MSRNGDFAPSDGAREKEKTLILANVSNRIGDYYSGGHALGLSRALRASGDIFKLL